MIPISIEDLLKKMAKDNKAFNMEDTKARLLIAVERKKKGARCLCGQSIWAVGSALSGFDMCYPCLMGKDDDSLDYELDIFCESNS